VHQKAKDQRRRDVRGNVYGGRWPAYSRAWIRKHPRCGERQDGHLYAEHSACVQQGIVTALGLPGVVMVTDHIRAVKQGGSFWDSANHQTLCRTCNSVKGIKHEGGFGR
jgi:5-methylcytosine-specific restriction endonuclease McrA